MKEEMGETMITNVTKEELRSIYHTYLYNDFPEDERKPLAMIESYLAKGMGEFVKYEVAGELVGYASLLLANNFVLLDYLAILPAYRGKGYGKKFMEELGKYYQTYDALYLESEAEESVKAKNRLDFYRACGCIVSDLILNLYYVDYYIVVLPLATKMLSVKEDIMQIYKMIYGEEFMRKYVREGRGY